MKSHPEGKPHVLTKFVCVYISSSKSASLVLGLFSFISVLSWTDLFNFENFPLTLYKINKQGDFSQLNTFDYGKVL